KEGLFLFRNGLSPYDGGVYHQAPLLLVFFHYLQPQLWRYIFVALDALVALCLADLAGHKRALQEHESWPALPPSAPAKDGGEKKQTSATTGHGSAEPDPTRPVDAPLRPEAVAAVYLLNPYSLLACMGQSTVLFGHAAAVSSLWLAMSGCRFASIFALALATYLDLYPVVLVIPCALLLRAKASNTDRGVWQAVTSASILLAVFVGCLVALSRDLAGSWDFLDATYGVMWVLQAGLRMFSELFVSDLTPNIGLYWYFFIEIFDEFRTFFLLVFQMFVVVFAVPLTIRFSEHPLFIAQVILMIVATFKSYPSVADVSLYLPFMAMHQELFKYRSPFLAGTLLLYATVLLPLFGGLWTRSSSGNANFFYAATLVAALAQVVLAVDAVRAMARREWDRLHPALRQTRVELVHA
ncbi:hypothetical protein HK405_007742, partial [Cladochytrium tenue]